jgi:hypothetical protein
VTKFSGLTISPNLNALEVLERLLSSRILGRDVFGSLVLRHGLLSRLCTLSSCIGALLVVALPFVGTVSHVLSVELKRGSEPY